MQATPFVIGSRRGAGSALRHSAGGAASLRPALRINGEIRGEKGFLEFRTAVERDGKRGAGGWLSVGSFSNVPFEVIEKTTAFQGELLEIAFTRRKRLRSGRNTATAVFAGSSWSECGKGPSGGSGGGDPSVSERAVYRGKRRSNPLPTGVGELSGRI